MSSRPVKENISTVFLLPAVQIKDDLKAKFHTFGFVNTFLFCDTLLYPFKPIYLLFKPAQFDLNFYAFLTQMEKNQNFIETLDLADGKVLIVYRIPRRFEADYETFLKGWYSRFTPEYKACFTLKRYVVDSNGRTKKDSSGKLLTEPTIFFHIFNRTEKLKEDWKKKLGEGIELPFELYEKYHEDRETFVEEEEAILSS